MLPGEYELVLTVAGLEEDSERVELSRARAVVRSGETTTVKMSGARP